MLGDTGVECVDGERFPTLDKSKPGLGHDEMEKTALTADRTVAFYSFDRSRRFNLEPHPAAMASTTMFDQVTFYLSPWGYAAASIFLLY